MIGLPNMIADTIQKTEVSLKDRGLPEDSYFEIEFEDGSKISEKETNWTFISERGIVNRLGMMATHFLCKFPIKSIKIFLNGMLAEILDVPKDCKVYQFVNSNRLISHDIDKASINGRGIGIVKDNKVIEEKFISLVENKVIGIRI